MSGDAKICVGVCRYVGVCESLCGVSVSIRIMKIAEKGVKSVRENNQIMRDKN